MAQMSSAPKILDTTEEWIVVLKPPGIPSCPRSPKTKDPKTLEGWLQQKFPEARLAHRLDNETSGVMIAARNETALRQLRQIWNTPQVTKTYRAEVEGSPPSQGRITESIAHHPRSSRRMRIGGPKARPAETRFRRIRQLKKTALLEIQITTGVRHQIRIHLAHLGHPIVGDRLYNKRANDDATSLQLELRSICIGKKCWTTPQIHNFSNSK